jgi:hypothetical protein
LKAGTRDQPPTAASYSGGRWKERAMFFIVLIVIVAVVMIVAVPRILRKR